jgi:hypothetical protein
MVSPKTVSVNRNRLVISLLFLLLTGAEFTVRGPLRAVQSATGFNDFLSPYIQAKAWIQGLDPYSPQTLLKLWPAEALQYNFLPKEVANGTLVANRGIPTAYPITAFVLLAPFDVVHWNVAYAAWLAINLTLFIAMLAVLISLAGFSLGDPFTIFFIAATLALAPFHTGIVTANVSLVVVDLAVIAVWLARQRYDFSAAILLAISAGLKPQIGLCFLLYYLLRRRWRLFAVGIAILIMLAGVGLLRLQFSHTPWLANYLNDNHILLETGVLGNFTSINPTRFGLINLQVGFHPILNSVKSSNILASVVGAILFIVWLANMARTQNDDPGLELLDLSTIATISLLPIYHRFYDAALLVLPLCLTFFSFRWQKAKLARIVTLFLLLPFLIPGGTLLETLKTSGRIPPTLAGRWWWQAFVMAHEVWALLFLSALLLYEMTVALRASRSGEETFPMASGRSSHAA